MATTLDHANGVNGAGPSFPPSRYSRVPPAITVAVAEADGPIDVEIALDDEIQDDPTELCTLLENEQSAKTTWVTVAIAYAKHKKVDVAIEVLNKAKIVFAGHRAEDRLSILNGLCWLYLLKCREAPRVSQGDQARTKEEWLQEATGVLNDASRISPSYPPLFLARGVLYLLRASLQTSQVNSERLDTLKQAAKCFEDALRASGGKNLMAKMGKARVSYTMGNWAEALRGYQTVLESSPGLVDPDPRIGIGCCFWQMGHKDDAASAWQRSLDLNKNSKIALDLLAMYNFYLTAQLPTSDPKFPRLTKTAMDYIQRSMAQDNKYPMTCAAVASWYVARKAFKDPKLEIVAKRAIELTDVNAIASDGWYQRARKEHYNEDKEKAHNYYNKADQARGADDKGYIPAKFGMAQMEIWMGREDQAKFRLEKILQQQPNVEAQTLLGTLYAQEVFEAQARQTSEDKSAEQKKALKYLEDVSKAWRDPKKNVTPDPSVLLNLARLYETDHPDKSLKCLEEVEQIELDGIPQEDIPEDIEDEAELKTALRELLPPQLLNNMGCFHYQAERFARARELFQIALNACVKAAAKDETIDTDALVTSISYNLGRTYESEGMHEEARGVFDGLLKRHPDYIDARIRLAYIALRQNPSDEGPKAVTKLFKDNEDNLEVRALFGWYLNKSKKKTLEFAADQEQRHYKHTLQKSDKHDKYSLTGMGNIHLTIAREMRRDSEQDKEKRHKTYERAVEFFDKVLQLDPKNAYAAQGIAIALVEDKKDYSTALQIFTKVKETLKDYTVYMNLGHTYCEIKQYTRAIENYEAALAKDRSHDPTILACLGRVWLMRGKHEKNLSAMKTSLEYSRKALEVAPGQIHIEFNVAFVQIQIAQLIHGLTETHRTLAEIEEASRGLEEAIETLEKIAKSPNPPYPGRDIEQRANMAKNTMRKQLERARQTQAKYEEENASKIKQAREIREAEIRKREEEKKKKEEEAEKRRLAILEKQKELEERDREYMEKRAEEERRRQELIDDSDMRKAERKSRGKGAKRKKKGDMDDSETEGVDSGSDTRPRRRRASTAGTGVASDEERPRQPKKRKLARKSEPVGKYKSAEMIVDSDSDGEVDVPADNDDASLNRGDSGDEGISAPRRKTARVIDEDEDDEDAGATQGASNGDVAMDDDEDE